MNKKIRFLNYDIKNYIFRFLSYTNLPYYNPSMLSILHEFPDYINRPPKIGEYIYYHLPFYLRKTNKSIQKYFRKLETWIVKIKDYKYLVACHYSIPQLLPKKPFIFRAGICTEIINKIYI